MDCKVLIADYFYGCPSTPISAPTTSSLHVSSDTAPKPTPGICTLDPPRKYNETWMLCNCMMARCIENNLIEITTKHCDPPSDITCTNELPPLNVTDKDGCCWHWECPCECKGFGDPHYVTFDGTAYDFQGECTYVLVEEINKEIQNFGIYADNYNCGDDVSCTRNLIIHYTSMKIEIGPESFKSSPLQVMVNRDIVGIPYKKNDVEISSSGKGYVVELIPLAVKIKFEDEHFIISLPYGRFKSNTQGLCGICSNNQADDCMLRNGTVIDDCALMAASWIVPNTNRPKCPSTKTTTTYTPVATCFPSSLCELIIGPTFKECNLVLTPDIYYQACIFDSCHVPDSNIECKTIQMYASLCLDQSICIDWRSKAPACNMTCPPEKVYLPCGPSVTPTCQTMPDEDELIINGRHLAEGCYCPYGTKPFSSTIDVCVEDCGCIGPDNIPRQFGERFEFNCKDCICREGGIGIFCNEKICPEKIVEVCDLEGFYPVTQARPDNPCCKETICMCNTSRCTDTLPKCDLGYEVAGGYVNGSCCPVYECVPKQVCVYRNAEYLLGSSVFSDPENCQVCICSKDETYSQGLFISCFPQSCDIDCPIGFRLKQMPGQCCGVCEQTDCVVISGDSVSLLKPGDIMPLKNDNCTVYKCMKEDDRLIHLVYKITCPLFFEEDCEPGTIHLDESDCCKLCIPQEHSCKLQKYKDYLSYDNCRSAEKIELSRCKGSCEAYSMFSPLSRSIAHQCSCCKEQKTTKKFVYLDCPDGTSVKFRYVDVDKCKCVETNCDQLK
ncbi:intestinal mucin-like protein [Xenopus laevis]|nr:intestinal mucin-like protein [Xenopus laevis]